MIVDFRFILGWLLGEFGSSKDQKVIDLFDDLCP